MSATIMSDKMSISSGPDNQQIVAKLAVQNEAEFVKCDCCGLVEECTQEYIKKVRERYEGKWICGLCGEAIKDEMLRSRRLISAEEAMNLHMSFCNKFKSSHPPIDPTVHLITAMRHILRRSLDFPRGLKSTPSSPTMNDRVSRVSKLARSESCFSALSG